ncbi:hypothetical protein ACLI1A_09310 [Flavobacterium sp. RHBU_3]|uniref:hypothetical protein n=1 Tax=Flavobacterium sp. RHBU_3 TaxID=3391184 RepID=UPI0039848FC7
MLKKIMIVVMVLVVLAITANFGITYYAKKKLPALLKEQKDFPYIVEYKDLDVNVWAGNFTVQGLQLKPKSLAKDTLKNTLFANVDEVSVRGLSIWQLLKHSRIQANRVEVIRPDATLYYTRRKYNVQDDVEKPFRQVVQTNALHIEGGRFRMLDSLEHPKFRLNNIDFTLTNIKVDSATVEKNIPLRYRDYTFSADSLYYNAGLHYNITADNISATDTSVVAKQFHLVPKYTRMQFNAMIPVEKDQFNVQANAISVHNIDWGFVNDTLYVHTPEVVLDKVNANIYRSKEVKDDPTRKKLYSELLRNLDFDLKVEKLLLKNADLQYEEQLTYKRPPAKVSFSKFYATVSNLYSPIRKGKLPNTAIDVQCLFMRKSPMTVNWSFNTLDVSDSFTIIGHLQNIRSEDINPVSKPLMNVTTKGNLRDIRFTFNGNRENGSGKFAIQYDHLKVDLYKKDGKKKNKIMTAVGNMLVKNDSDGELKETTPEVTRKKDKSVFNFLWRFVQQGLKETVLPEIVQGD